MTRQFLEEKERRHGRIERLRTGDDPTFNEYARQAIKDAIDDEYTRKDIDLAIQEYIYAKIGGMMAVKKD